MKNDVIILYKKVGEKNGNEIIKEKTVKTVKKTHTSKTKETQQQITNNKKEDFAFFNFILQLHTHSYLIIISSPYSFFLNPFNFSFISPTTTPPPLSH